MNTRKQQVMRQITLYLYEARQKLADATTQEQINAATDEIRHWNEQISRAHCDLPIIYK